MKSRIILSAFLVSVLLPSAYAQQRLVDPREFDIAGVKIGMDFDEARAAAAKYLKISPSEIRVHSPKPGETQYGGFMRGVEAITGAKHPSSFFYEKDKVWLGVYFEPRLPADKTRPLAVFEVAYAIPHSKENEAAMKKAALAKYGEPTIDRISHVSWCATPNKVAKMCMYINYPVLELRPGTSIDPASFGAKTGIMLHDPTWAKAREQFLQDLKDSKAKATPNF